MRSSACVALICAMMLLLGIPGTSHYSRADSTDWAAGAYMSGALDALQQSAEEATKDTQYGLISGTSVLGAFIQPDGVVTYRLTLLAGTNYLFVGGADEDAKDMDIEITEDDGTVVASDVDFDAKPAVRFTPRKEAQYTIQLKLVKASAGCFCLCALLVDGGYKDAIAQLSTSAAQLIGYCNDQFKNFNYKLKFQDKAGEWALLGAVLEPGKRTGVINMHIGEGSHSIVAAGGDTVQDVRLYLQDAGGAALESDVVGNARANVVYSTDATTGYAVYTELVNTSDSQPALVLTAITRRLD